MTPGRNTQNLPVARAASGSHTLPNSAFPSACAPILLQPSRSKDPICSDAHKRRKMAVCREGRMSRVAARCSRTPVFAVSGSHRGRKGRDFAFVAAVELVGSGGVSKVST